MEDIVQDALMMVTNHTNIDAPEKSEILSDTSSIGYDGNLLLDNLEEVKIECP